MQALSQLDKRQRSPASFGRALSSATLRPIFWLSIWAMQWGTSEGTMACFPYLLVQQPLQYLTLAMRIQLADSDKHGKNDRRAQNGLILLKSS
jgi:hypothetical protein